MSAKRDRVNNEMVIPFCNDQGIVAGTVFTSPAYDSMLGRSNPTNMLVILMMKTWGAGGRVVVRVQDSLIQTGPFFVTSNSFASAPQISGNTTFVGQADGFRRWVRLRISCITGSVNLTAIGVLAKGRREPVPQHDFVGELSSGSSESSSSSSSSSESSSSSSSSESSSSSSSSSESSSSSSESSSSSSESSSSSSSLGKWGSQQPT